MAVIGGGEGTAAREKGRARKSWRLVGRKVARGLWREERVMSFQTSSIGLGLGFLRREKK